MKNKENKNFGLGLLLTGAALGAGAVLLSVLRQKHREQIYHEAEIKAMDELDELMAQEEEACAACECAENCAENGGECVLDGQMEMDEEPALPEDAFEAEDEEPEPEDEL